MLAHAIEVLSIRIGVLAIQVLSAGGGYCLPVFAYQVVCFYDGSDSMSACQQTAVADGWMKGRSSTPKQRALCRYRLDWLVAEWLAECVPL